MGAAGIPNGNKYIIADMLSSMTIGALYLDMTGFGRMYYCTRYFSKLNLTALGRACTWENDKK